MESQLTHEESLRTISQMINTAKGNVREGSFFFLLWGWVVAICNFGHYLLLTQTDYEHPYIIWALTFPAAIVSAIYGARLKKKTEFVSYYDRLYSLVWIAMGVGITLVIIFGQRINFNINPVVLLFAGSGTFLSGQLLKFKPLILGGVALWLSAAIAFNVSEPYQYLIGCIGIILGYLVPAYMLKNQTAA